MGLPGSDAVRSSGTFNFTLFFGIWTALVVSFAVGEWLQPKHRRVLKNSYLLLLCTVTANLCHLVSGSRSGILLAAGAIGGGVFAAVLMRSMRVIATVVGIFLLMPILGAAVEILAPHEADAIVERFTGSGYQQEATSRTSTIATGFLTDPPFSLIGAGIGMGIDAAHLGEANSTNSWTQFSEWDTTRIVDEVGTPVGLFIDFTRIVFGLGMIYLAAQLVRRGGSPHVLPIAVYCFLQVYLGDLTRSGAMTFAQITIAYSFLLGVYLSPGTNAEPGSATEIDQKRFA